MSQAQRPPTPPRSEGHLHSAAGPVAGPGGRGRSSAACRPVWRCRCGSSLRCHGNKGDYLRGRGRVSGGGGVLLETEASLPTQLPPVHRLGGVDGRQGREASLDARASVSTQLVHALDHLLLPVDPVQVLPQDRQPRRLQDARVLEDDPIGSWGSRQVTATDSNWGQGSEVATHPSGRCFRCA